MAAQPRERPDRAIRRSDVVFMYDNPKMYQPYGCTVMGWGGWANAKRIKLAHSKGVRVFSCSIGFRTEFRRVIDFSDDFLDAACRDFAGKPFIVPWLWDHKHKGKPAYWWCTNSPLYRRYLESRLVEVMTKAKPDGLHIDDYTGTAGCVTWLSGCFCAHCMAAFRDHLAENVPEAKLDRLGITGLKSFDYRRFLLGRGVKPEEYKKRRARLPLAAEFHHFQVMASNRFVVAFRKRAEELRGEPITLSVNSGLNSPQSLVIAPHLSYFCCEVGHQAGRRQPPTHPVYIYKVADGLDRPVASTAGGWDWAFINEHKLPGLVRTWIALSYAFGHTFMAPHRQWCYTKKKGTHWYSGPTREYAYIYQFVRQHSRLLDGYEAVAPVAVVYSNAASRKRRGRIEIVCATLARTNVPFTVVVAGDDWLDYRLTVRQLARFKAVVVTKTTDLDPKQRELIDRVAAEGRLVTWPNKERLAQLAPPPVVVEGSGHVWAVPRAIPGDRKKPVVVHLLNRRYDAGNDAMVPQRGLTLRLRRDLFGGRKFTKATLHAPKAEPLRLKIVSDSDHTTIQVPQLGLWAIVELGS